VIGVTRRGRQLIVYQVRFESFKIDSKNILFEVYGQKVPNILPYIISSKL
jgi:hypothetical protein